MYRKDGGMRQPRHRVHRRLAATGKVRRDEKSSFM